MFIQNEPIAAKRTFYLELKDHLGTGISDYSGLVIKVSKAGGNFAAADAGTAITALTGGPPGAAKLVFAIGDWDTVGLFAYSITKTDVEWTDSIIIDPNADEGRLWYGTTTAGAAGSITLDATAPAVAHYFAGNGRNCMAVLVTGQAKGQSAFATEYSSGRALTIAPNFAGAGPTGGGGDVVMLIPFTGQLDAATIATILADSRFDHLDADVSSRLAPMVAGHEEVLVDAAGHVGPDWSQIGTPGSTVNLSATTLFALSTTERAAVSAAIWDLAITGHHSTGSFGELLQVVAGLLHMHGRIDNTVFSAQGILTFGRLRCFASAAASASAVDGHSDNTDGELFRFTITATDNGDGTYSNFKVVRNL